MARRKSKLAPAGYIVAIDGPAGAGKSTVSKKLAKAIKGQLLDTGSMYRAVAYFALKNKQFDKSALVTIAKGLHFDIESKSGVMLVNGDSLGDRLRTERVSLMASQVSQYQEIRKILTARQRSIARKWSRKMPVIVEGRDIGSVVFPKVRFKFFVTADAKIRAKRRLRQLKKQGATDVTLNTILLKHQKRDNLDSTRKVAPLKCPTDAVVVDTSRMVISQVVQFMANHIQAKNLTDK